MAGLLAGKLHVMEMEMEAGGRPGDRESLRFMLGRDGKMSANLTDSHMKVVDRLLTDRLRDADMGANEEDSTFRSHGMLRFE